jgi:hypothetical protein
VFTTSMSWTTNSPLAKRSVARLQLFFNTL